MSCLYALLVFPRRCRFPGAVVSAAAYNVADAAVIRPRCRLAGRFGWEAGLDVGCSYWPGVIAGRDVELSVRGMTCAACAARVEKKLNAMDNVSATVNFATGKARVTAPASVPVARLIEAVEQAGYGAELAAACGGRGRAGGCQRGGRLMRTGSLICGAG